MIQANSLRIGNNIQWLHEDSATILTVDAAMILDIDNYNRFPESEEYSRGMWWAGIPLAPEILEGFGFIKKKDWFYKEQFIIGFLTTDSHFQTEYKMAGLDAEWKLLDIKFVHQLQNLYYCLTSTELK